MQQIINCDALELMTSEIPTNKNICIITDPPFNINYHYNVYKDNQKENEYLDYLAKVLTIRNCPFVVILYPEMICKLSIKLNLAPIKIVSWVYNSNTGRQHRDIAFYNIKPDFRKVKQPYKNLNDKRIKERMARGIGGGRLYDWWNINQVKNVSKSKNKINHPCVMPLEVMEKIIEILPNDYIIVDPFCGSGTTGVACKELGRDFIGCDISKEYCELAIERIKN